MRRRRRAIGIFTPEHVALACDIARAAWPSGKYAEQVLGVVRDIIDRNHLADRSPLATSAPARRRKGSDPADRPVLRKRLDDQKTPHKLPDQKALWELVRIVFTETPRSPSTSSGSRSAGSSFCVASASRKLARYRLTGEGPASTSTWRAVRPATSAASLGPRQ